jgi:hypothetical protein
LKTTVLAICRSGKKGILRDDLTRNYILFYPEKREKIRLVGNYFAPDNAAWKNLPARDLFFGTLGGASLV